MKSGKKSAELNPISVETRLETILKATGSIQWKIEKNITQNKQKTELNFQNVHAIPEMVDS